MFPALAGAQYTYVTNTPNTNTITITGYTDAGEDVEIPTQIGGKTVTVIGLGAFNGSSIRSVTVPDSVTYISHVAFQDCSSLTNIVIGNGVRTIGAGAFKGSGLTSVTIPSNVTSILDLYFSGQAGAFQDCTGLTNVLIGDGLNEISDMTFESCRMLRCMVIGKALTRIGNYAFDGCISLTNTALPNTLTNIGTGAFWMMKSVRLSKR